MPLPPLDDRALEALLSGASSPPAGFDWLVPFVEDLGNVARRPAPERTPALAALLAGGVSFEAGELPVAGRMASRTTRRRRVAAKAALGLGLVAVSTTAAGAVGALPQAAQHALATVVEAATPFSFPDEARGRVTSGATVSPDATGASDRTPRPEGNGRSGAAGTEGEETVAGSVGAAEGSTGNGTAVGANPGATGLDRARQTPAAGHVPSSVPAAREGAGSNGPATAAGTPAADRVPPGVPPVIPGPPATAGSPAGANGSTGLDTAGSTPAGTRPPSRR